MTETALIKPGPQRSRRLLLAAAAALPLLPAATAHAAPPVADVLERPALRIRLSSRPSMLRIARAGKRLVAVGERGVVLLSDDEGAGWRQAEVPVSVTLTGVRFVDEQLGWAIGHSAVVLHTRDGGQTWALQHDGRRIADGLALPLLDLHFDDARRGWAVGAYGLMLRTNDGGAAWQPMGQSLPNPKQLHLYALARQGTRLVIAGEQGTFIALATDGSASALTTPYRGSFFSAAALPDDALLLGGLRGTLLLRTAGGEFRTLDSGTQQAIVSINALPQQRHALVDQSGRVLLGRAPQGPFRPLRATTVQRWAAVVANDGGGLVAAGNAGMGVFDAKALAAASA